MPLRVNQRAAVKQNSGDSPFHSLWGRRRRRRVHNAWLSSSSGQAHLPNLPVLPPRQILHCSLCICCCICLTLSCAVVMWTFPVESTCRCFPLPLQSTVGWNNLWMRAIIYLKTPKTVDFFGRKNWTVDFFEKCFKGLNLLNTWDALWLHWQSRKGAI